MDTIRRDIQKPSPWCMLYADDKVLCEETKEKMNVTGTPSLDDQLKYPKVDRFTYLGSMLQEGGCTKEVNAWIQKGWLKWRSISGVMCDKKMPIWLKSKVNKSIVRLVLIYGRETWSLNATEEKLLHGDEYGGAWGQVDEVMMTKKINPDMALTQSRWKKLIKTNPTTVGPYQ
ncbi:unnamed protein product [Gordionus sp. m RMFG-2023]